jgi:hypothetical protein
LITSHGLLSENLLYRLNLERKMTRQESMKPIGNHKSAERIIGNDERLRNNIFCASKSYTYTCKYEKYLG